MTAVQLEYLVAVAKNGSFSSAAVECNVTQPSLSIQIKNLEDELGVTIFDRTTKPLLLTDGGKVVYNQAQKALAQFYLVKESVKEHKNKVSGTLRLAAIPTIAPYLLHRFVSEFITAYPEVTIEIKELFTRDILTGLADNSIDIAIWAMGFAAGEDVVEEPLFKDQFYLYAAPSNPILEQEEVSVIDLDVNKLLMLADGHCLRTQILDICNSRNPIGSNLKMEGGSLETIMRMVDKSGTATIIPQIVVDFLPEEKRRNVRPIREKSAASRVVALATSGNFIKYGMKAALKEQILKSMNQI